MASSFFFQLELPLSVEWEDGSVKSTISRNEFYSFLWQRWGGEHGLIGVFEGSVLSGDSGPESSWVVDEAQAPMDRDWVSAQEVEKASFYFDTQIHAELALVEVRAKTALVAHAVLEQKDEDWDAQWKRSFQGVDVPPYWEIRPSWKRLEQKPIQNVSKKTLWINPGAGFGTGTHETTQLCLELLSGVVQGKKALDVLDFGSGSGILSIASALLGASVDSVEIDPLAIENAKENAKLNQVGNQISFSTHLPLSSRKYALVIANILRPVLIEFAPSLCERIGKSGTLILSGLIESDVQEVTRRFMQQEALKHSQPSQIYRLGEWRAIVFQT